ncbi:MAG: DUF2891 domain-containing protein [Komarekiella atlantica HA4396-MV6]|jgi:hypothetical protein|nr:DUF2891 domain-containing protein [Komarekiella atlantica HA4396-MV6]
MIMPADNLEINETTAAQFTQLVLNCIEREYPHSNICWADSDQDIKPPRELTPAFYGCLDWHSAVHGHWLLVRLMRHFPEASFSVAAKQALEQSLTPEKIQGEIAHFQRLPFFECPYGVAWLLQLAAELHEWNHPQAREWRVALEPLEKLIAGNLHRWIDALQLPNRTGTHNQTAFALGLILDWARITENADFTRLVENKAQQFYLSDRNYSLQFEPLGYDFSSPSLAQADLMRRVLPTTVFTEWLTNFLPQIPIENTVNWLEPVKVNNPQDYMESHFHGLNLSRAWMLEGIISGLPNDDQRIETLRSAAVQHRQSGLANVVSEYYAASHWLGTFAVYLITNRGLQRQSNLTTPLF